MEVNLKELAQFLVKAKRNTYAGDRGKVPPKDVERPGFKELKFSEGEWKYRDSYTGFYAAPGQEVVRFKGVPVWAMAYSGGMKLKDIGNEKLAKQTFDFLKKALMKVDVSKPFRGPQLFDEGPFRYYSLSKGDLTNFTLHEHIKYKGREVFSQECIGGLIIHKNDGISGDKVI